jgi:hypothetical protein
MFPEFWNFWAEATFKPMRVGARGPRALFREIIKMTIKKHDFIAKLKIPLHELWEARVYIGKGIYEILIQIPVYDLNRCYETTKLKFDRPIYIAHAKDTNTILVYPKTDKRYKIKVVGTQIVEQ